jgi:DnaJ-class molecular chaperone
MSMTSSEQTSAFARTPCADCSGTGELRMEGENINENFEVENQTVITPCPRCGGSGFVKPDEESTIQGTL